MDESLTGMRPSSLSKRRSMLNAATHLFVASGYDGTTVDDVAATAGVSKQTVYSHFGTKDALFTQVILESTTTAFTAMTRPDAAAQPADLRGELSAWADRQLDAVLDPTVLALRRLVIAEQTRFPTLAATFWRSGPQRAIEALAELLARLHDTGLAHIPDPLIAATSFNWLVMADATNRAMLLGTEALPGTREKRVITDEAVRVFLAAYGPRAD